MEMWLGQDSLSNPIHPERLSPPPSLVSDFEELHTGKPFAPTRRSQTRAHIRFELVASKLLFVDEHKRDAVTRRQNGPLSPSSVENLFHLGKTWLLNAQSARRRMELKGFFSLRAGPMPDLQWKMWKDEYEVHFDFLLGLL